MPNPSPSGRTRVKNPTLFAADRVSVPDRDFWSSISGISAVRSTAFDQLESGNGVLRNGIPSATKE